MKTIVIDKLTKRFGPLAAVDDLSFTVEAGRVTGLLGPNGAGKTTTLRSLLGLVRPTSGTATFGGIPFAELPSPVRTVGAVLEATSFHPGRRAHDHLRSLAIAAELDPQRPDEVLDLVGLTTAGGRRVGGFSLGMRQRLALAGALLGDPETLILDEPTNGLDPDGVRWLRNLIRHLAGQGRTVLISSHLLAEVAQTVDDVVVIAGGRLVAQGPLEQVTGLGHRPGERVAIRTPQASQLLEAMAASGLDASLDGGRVVVAGATPEQVGAVIARAGVVVYEMQALDRTLEDVFFELTHPEVAHR